MMPQCWPPKLWKISNLFRNPAHKTPGQEERLEWDRIARAVNNMFGFMPDKEGTDPTNKYLKRVLGKAINHLSPVLQPFLLVLDIHLTESCYQMFTVVWTKLCTAMRIYQQRDSHSSTLKHYWFAATHHGDGIGKMTLIHMIRWDDNCAFHSLKLWTRQELGRMQNDTMRMETPTVLVSAVLEYMPSPNLSTIWLRFVVNLSLRLQLQQFHRSMERILWWRERRIWIFLGRVSPASWFMSSPTGMGPKGLKKESFAGVWNQQTSTALLLQGIIS